MRHLNLFFLWVTYTAQKACLFFFLAGLAELRAAHLQADYRAVYVMFKSSRWVRSVLFSMCKDVLYRFAAGQVAATDGMSYSPLVVCKACVHASCPVTPVADAD